MQKKASDLLAQARIQDMTLAVLDPDLAGRFDASLALAGKARGAKALWRTHRRAALQSEVHANEAKATFIAQAVLIVEQARQRPAVPEPKTLAERVSRLVGHPAT